MLINKNFEGKQFKYHLLSIFNEWLVGYRYRSELVLF
jgi:hypothetical protein